MKQLIKHFTEPDGAQTCAKKNSVHNGRHPHWSRQRLRQNVTLYSLCHYYWWNRSWDWELFNTLNSSGHSTIPHPCYQTPRWKTVIFPVTSFAVKILFPSINHLQFWIIIAPIRAMSRPSHNSFHFFFFKTKCMILGLHMSGLQGSLCQTTYNCILSESNTKNSEHRS